MKDEVWEELIILSRVSVFVGVLNYVMSCGFGLFCVELVELEVECYCLEVDCSDEVEYWCWLVILIGCMSELIACLASAVFVDF